MVLPAITELLMVRAFVPKCLISTAFTNEDRAQALETALHWLVESEQCAGGVEGAIILQQAALECLAWREIVLERRICSESGFKSLPASDKIKWLLSLHNIQAAIPDKSAPIKSYAKAFNHEDLIDVLVDVRNALVHAEPKKAARLFGRNQGDEERGGLWYQVGGGGYSRHSWHRSDTVAQCCGETSMRSTQLVL